MAGTAAKWRGDARPRRLSADHLRQKTDEDQIRCKASEISRSCLTSPGGASLGPTTATQLPTAREGCFRRQKLTGETSLLARACARVCCRCPAKSKHCATPTWHASCIERGQTSVGHDTPKRRRHHEWWRWADSRCPAWMRNRCGGIRYSSHNSGNCGHVVDWFACRVLVQRSADRNTSAGATSAHPGQPVDAVGGSGCTNRRTSSDRQYRSASWLYPAARLAPRSIGLSCAPEVAVKQQEACLHNPSRCCKEELYGPLYGVMRTHAPSPRWK